MSDRLYRSIPYLFFASFALGWFRPIDAVGVGDWDQFFTYAWLCARGFLERGAPPSWTVQLSGGAPLAADPQALSHSPLLLFPLAFGPIVGTKLLTAISILAGIAGMQRIAERWIGDALGAAVAAFVFVFSGYFALHFRAGHFPWGAFFLVPWMLYFGDRILFETTPRRRDSLGFLVATTLLFSGTVYHPLVYFVLPLGFAYGVASRSEGRAGARRHLVLLFGCAFLLTFPRWLAILEWHGANPRGVAVRGGMPLVNALEMLVTPIDDYRHRVTWGIGGIWEYWCYVGIPAATLALLSFRRPSFVRRLAVACLVTATILVWQGWHGNVLGWFAPRIPFLASVRVYSRFVGLAVFAIAIAAGAEIARLRRASRSAWLAVAVALLVVADYSIVTRPIWAKVFSLSPTDIYPDWGVEIGGERYGEVRAAPAFQPLVDDREMVNSRMLPLVEAGAILSNAYVAPNVPGTRPSPGSTIRAAGGATVRITDHAIDVDGDLARGQRIDLRLRYAKQIWRSTDRSAVRLESSLDGMRIVVLRPIRHVRVELRRGREIWPWLVVVLGVAASVAIVSTERGLRSSIRRSE